ncbi:MAG: hypothetical protein IKJ39_11445 [Lachnospiraceae bacterium]|nr:hypothetical protein [Lachnospiraceae bacterium]
MIIVFLIASVLLSFFSLVAKECYRLGRSMRNIGISLLLLITLTVHSALIYFIATKLIFLTIVPLIAFYIYWFMFAPFYVNSDPAGAGMAHGFHAIIGVGSGIIFGIIFYVLIILLSPLALYIALGFYVLIGLYSIYYTYYCYTSGGEFQYSAMRENLSYEQYRRTLFRESMVKKGDPWEAKELDDWPKEITHYNVFGSKLEIKSFDSMPCLLLEASFIHASGEEETIDTIFGCGILEYIYNDAREDDFIPKHIAMVWRDLSEGKTYRIDADLPEELSSYSDTVNKDRDDDLDFVIMPGGRVLMYHNRYNQIHNIMIDYPLQGVETNEYDERIAEYFAENNINLDHYAKKELPDVETIDNYLKRFPYTVSFVYENERYKTQKSICNFFNGEKILSAEQWVADIEPARIKDVFLRFQYEQSRYSCFLFFNEDEILSVFKEAFETGDAAGNGEFVIKAGRNRNDFTFTLKVADKAYTLKKCEIRLYKNNEDDRGRLVFKNYKGERKNLLRGLWK